jgi:hypothetical protein
MVSLSTALGVAAACLVGLTREESLVGLESELSNTHLRPSQREANRQLAHAVYTQAQSWTPVSERVHDPASPVQARLHKWLDNHLKHVEKRE